MSDAIVLVGLSGSGKSTVAAAVAERLGRPLVDLDQDIAARLGAHPAHIIETRGEAAFRADEAAAVALACAVDGAVIATGGGAVIDPLSRWALWNAGLVCWLDAPDEVLLERLAGHAEIRPLLGGDAAGRLATQRIRRERFYRAADVRVDASAPTEVVVEAVVRATQAGTPRARRLLDAEVRRDHLMGPDSARVVLGNELDAATLADVLQPTSSGIPVVVADRRVAKAQPALMAALPGERQILIASGERQKRLRTVDKLLEAASAMGAERGDAWVGVGGGVTTDMVGAAAALYVRGVNFVAVTTTWLGMTDAAIGGKVAVDLSGAKNAAGAFWPPAAIVGDVATQRTLPRAAPARRHGRVAQVGDHRRPRAVGARRDAREGRAARRRGRPLRHHRPLRAAEAGRRGPRSLRAWRAAHLEPGSHAGPCPRDREWLPPPSWPGRGAGAAGGGAHGRRVAARSRAWPSASMPSWPGWATSSRASSTRPS